MRRTVTPADHQRRALVDAAFGPLLRALPDGHEQLASELRFVISEAVLSGQCNTPEGKERLLTLVTTMVDADIKIADEEDTQLAPTFALALDTLRYATEKRSANEFGISEQERTEMLEALTRASNILHKSHAN